MKQLDKLLADRTESERLTLLVGALVAIPLFVWLLVWQPLLSASASAETKLAQKQKSHQWMLGAAAQIKALAPRGTQRALGSPSQLITSAGREQGISINRIEPQSGGRFNVWIARADYNAAVRFVDVLISSGLVVENATMAGVDVPGIVSVRLTVGASE